MGKDPLNTKEEGQEMPKVAYVDSENTEVSSDIETEEESAQIPVANPSGTGGEFHVNSSEFTVSSSGEAPAEELILKSADQSSEKTTVIEESNYSKSVRRTRYPPRRGAAAREILLKDIIARSKHAHPNLKEQLNGTVLVQLFDSDQAFLVDWRSQNLKAEETSDTQADCVICLDERDLESIASGVLNPQIAMVSDKMKITGNTSLAMYFFNLIVPPGQN